MDYLGRSALLGLLQDLRQRTAARTLPWVQGDNEFEFVTHGKKFVYTISSADKDDYSPYRFRILKGDPSAAKGLVNSSTVLQEVVTRTNSPVNDDLQSLYRTVKRTTLSIDEVASEILSDFD